MSNEGIVISVNIKECDKRAHIEHNLHNLTKPKFTYVYSYVHLCLIKFT
jgi:hypothetical protein